MAILDIIVGGGIGGGFALFGTWLSGHLGRKWEKEKWLLDHEAKDCVECIELLWKSKPPWSKDHMRQYGWETKDDLLGRLQTLQLIPAKMASIMLYPPYRGEDTTELEQARDYIKKQIDKIRAAPDDMMNQENKPARNPYELPEAMDQAETAVENYLKRIRELQKVPQDDLMTRVRTLICGRQSGSLP